MRIQQHADQLPADMTIETSGNQDRGTEKESFPTQLYRHIKVDHHPTLYGIPQSLQNYTCVLVNYELTVRAISLFIDVVFKVDHASWPSPLPHAE